MQLNQPTHDHRRQTQPASHVQLDVGDFTRRHHLSEEVAKRIVEKAISIDQADAIAELMK